MSLNLLLFDWTVAPWRAHLGDTRRMAKQAIVCKDLPAPRPLRCPWY